jgi:hypothetical protein
VKRCGWDDRQHEQDATRRRSPPGQSPLTRDLSDAGGLRSGDGLLVDGAREMEQR